MCSYNMFKKFGYFLNFVFLLLATSQILYGTYCLIYLYLINKTQTLAQYSLGIPSLFMILCGIILFSTLCIGCTGLAKEIPCVVHIYASILIALALFQLAFAGLGMTMTMDPYRNNTENLKQDIEFTFKNYHKEQYYVDAIQTLFSCCGIVSPDYWKDMKPMLPNSCCTGDVRCAVNSTAVHALECMEPVISFNIYNNEYILYVSVASGVLELIAAISAISWACLQSKNGYYSYRM